MHQLFTFMKNITVIKLRDELRKVFILICNKLNKVSVEEIVKERSVAKLIYKTKIYRWL